MKQKMDLLGEREKERSLEKDQIKTLIVNRTKESFEDVVTTLLLKFLL